MGGGGGVSASGLGDLSASGQGTCTTVLPGKHPPTRQTPPARQTLPPDRHPQADTPTYWNPFLFLNVFTKQALRVTHHPNVFRTLTCHLLPTRVAVFIFSVFPKMKYYLHSGLNCEPLPFLFYGNSTELIWCLLVSLRLEALYIVMLYGHEQKTV